MKCLRCQHENPPQSRFCFECGARLAPTCSSCGAERCLAGDVATTGGAEDAESYYREALALAGELGMRPLVAHCYLGLGTLYWRTGGRQEAQEHLTTATTMYREMDMRFWLEKAEMRQS